MDAANKESNEPRFIEEGKQVKGGFNREFTGRVSIAEVFKPVLADRLIFKLFNRGQLSDKHFAQNLNCCCLKEAGREIVLQKRDKRLNTTLEHRRLKRSISCKRLIRLECCKLVKH